MRKTLNFLHLKIACYCNNGEKKRKMRMCNTQIFGKSVENGLLRNKQSLVSILHLTKIYIKLCQFITIF